MFSLQWEAGIVAFNKCYICLQDTGKLEVTITYHSRVLKLETEPGTGGLSRSAPSSTVCISLGVVRASGLKSAATALARHDGGMQYAAEVGVNSYVRVRLSFLPKEVGGVKESLYALYK